VTAVTSNETTPSRQLDFLRQPTLADVSRMIHSPTIADCLWGSLSRFGFSPKWPRRTCRKMSTSHPGALHLMLLLLFSVHHLGGDVAYATCTTLDGLAFTAAAPTTATFILDLRYGSTAGTEAAASIHLRPRRRASQAKGCRSFSLTIPMVHSTICML
jgi:hypothetical protein